MLRVNNLSGFGRFSAGGGYDADAQAFFTAAGISDDTQKTAVNDLVVALKADGIWAKCIALYPFVGGSSSSHAVNLKNPGTYDITWGGTVTHDSNGITGNGTTGYGNTGVTPNSHLSLDDNHISIYCRTTGANEAKGDMGSVAAAGSSYYAMYIRYTNAFLGYMPGASGGDDMSAGNTDAQGFYIATRTSSTHLEGYKNGSSIATETGSRSAGSMPSIAMYICGVNFNGSLTEPSARNYAFASAGSGLTDTEAANFHTAVEAYQDALSRGVVA